MCHCTPADALISRIAVLKTYLAEQGFTFKITQQGYCNGQYEGEIGIGVFSKNNLSIEIGYFYSIRYVNYSNGDNNSVSHKKYMGITS